MFGIDLGGTKIEGVVLKSSNIKEVLFRERIPTEGNKGYQHVLSRIATMVKMMEKATGESCQVLGIGTPGSLDPQTGLLKNSNSTQLNGKPFLSDLEKIINCEVRIANDANCFALAETLLGIVPEISPEAEVVFGVIMGTGVGGGLIVNGKVIGGKQGIAGEWGHNFLDESGGACYCGKVGCVEKILAGPWLEKYHESIFGEHVSLKEIVKSAHSDYFAKETMDRLHHFFGKGIASIINMIDPEVIVIGGGVGNIQSLYSEGIEKVEEFVFNTRLDTKIVAPKLGDSAGVFGAALLAR